MKVFLDDERQTPSGWVEEAVATRGFIPPRAIRVHSANSGARPKMEQGIESIYRLAARHR